MSTSKTIGKQPLAVTPLKRSQYFMPEEYKRDLDILAERQGTSAAELVRKAVGAYLRRHGFAG